MKKLIIYVLFIFTLSSCFFRYDLTLPDTNMSEEEAKEVLLLEGYLDLSDKNTLLENFMNFEYEYEMYYGDQFIDVVNVNFTLTNDGSGRQNIKLIIDGQRTEWFFNNNNLIKGEVEGMQVEEKNLDFTFSEFYGVAFYPFIYLNEIGVKSYLQDEFKKINGKFVLREEASISNSTAEAYIIRVDMPVKLKNIKNKAEIKILVLESSKFISEFNWKNYTQGNISVSYKVKKLQVQ